MIDQLGFSIAMYDYQRVHEMILSNKGFVLQLAINEGLGPTNR
jgi:hypothetical protein